MPGAGVYGGTRLTQEQYDNAAVIARTGYGMGASTRDVQVALMAAMQESSLRNLHYGDRDSQGLFQQRPSQGWGSVAQVTNPVYAATQFFKHLLGIGNRGSLSLNDQAQRVQRSGTPSAYAKWQGMAGQLVSAIGGGKGAPDLSGAMADVGGIGRGPAQPGDSWGTSLVDAVKGIGKSIEGMVSGVAAVGKFAEAGTKLFLPSNMVRIASGCFGAAFVFIGITMLGREVKNG